MRRERVGAEASAIRAAHGSWGAARRKRATDSEPMESSKTQHKGEKRLEHGLLHRMSVDYLLNGEERAPAAGASGAAGASSSMSSKDGYKTAPVGKEGARGGAKGGARGGGGKEKAARRFTCERCGCAFGMRSNLKRHIATVHEQRRVFRCELCGAAFGLKQNLCTHVRVKHLKVRAFQCEVCRYNFGYKQVLQNHRRSVHGLM